MRTFQAVMLILTIAVAAGMPAGSRAAGLGPLGATGLSGRSATAVALGCGPGHTRGHFGACVELHHRHDRIHGRHRGHNYDIHDRRHYHEDPHLYHGRHHRHGPHERHRHRH